MARKNKTVENAVVLLIIGIVLGTLSAFVKYIKEHPGVAIIAITVVVICSVLLMNKDAFKSKSSKSKPYSTKALQDLSVVDNMSGLEFEAWCAKLLKKNGFSHVKVTPGSGDQGVDIIAWKNNEKYAIQCKRYSNAVGNKPVQEVYTGETIYGCSRAIVITNNYFTTGAIQAARATNVELWDRNTLAKLIG